jgi:D-alanine-D-alanine ligase
MTKVAILFGGTSSEYEISIKTGRFLIETLDKNKYELYPIYLTKNREWIFKESPSSSFSWEKDLSPSQLESYFIENSFLKSKNFPFHIPYGVCVLGLHGGEGEDGTLQGFLDTIQIPYTGSGILASALAMDKFRANQIFQMNGLNVSPYFEISKSDFYNPAFILENVCTSFPYFVKPTCGGSSVSTGIVKSLKETEIKLKELFLHDERALLQKPIQGIEVSCGVIDRKTNNKFTPTALYPTEIIPSGDFFDFVSKYTVGKSQEITPARISDSLTSTIQSMSVKAHTILGCRGYSRSDFLIQDMVPYILETNTLPGMTETSLIPQQVAYQGENMSDILDLLIENALSSI